MNYKLIELSRPSGFSSFNVVLADGRTIGQIELDDSSGKWNVNFHLDPSGLSNNKFRTHEQAKRFVMNQMSSGMYEFGNSAV
ncbi:MAG: hypothetical protein ABI878_12780 [Acidobacteriota bacterium]